MKLSFGTCDEDTYIQNVNYKSWNEKKKWFDWYTWTWNMLTFGWNKSSVQPWRIRGGCAARGSRPPEYRIGNKSWPSCICIWPTDRLYLYPTLNMKICWQLRCLSSVFEILWDGDCFKPAGDGVAKLDKSPLVDRERAKSVKLFRHPEGSSEVKMKNILHINIARIANAAQCHS